MAQVMIDVGGRRYEVSCRAGGEDRLRMLGRLVDARLTDVSRSLGRGLESRELLMTALLLADELEDLRAATATAALDEASRAHAIERCAERLEALATRLEAPSSIDGLETRGEAH